MPITPTDQLRLLNLAYTQMQGDVARILPDLFRGDEQLLTADSSGYIYLLSSTFEVEAVTLTSGKTPLAPMHKKNRFAGTGWYHDGVQTSGPSAGKKRIMIRNCGAAWANAAITVDALIEYPALSDTDGVPYPFVQQRYLNMLTELQTFMLNMEGGKEAAGEAEKHWNAYQFLLGQLKKDSLDKVPRYMSISHADAGDSRAFNRLRNA